MSTPRTDDPPARIALVVGADAADRALVAGLLRLTGWDVREAAALCPLDRLLVETDAPYLAPVPHRGRTNEPAFVPLVGAAVAGVKGVPAEEIEAATWNNMDVIFRLADLSGPV